jgi:steroid delta-isomerase-like uncharacterized protein
MSLASSIIKLRRILKMHTTNTQSMGSAEEQKNKQVVRQYIEAFNRQDTERLGQLVSSTNQSFQFSGMHPSMDWNRTKQFFAAFWSAFPDLSAKIEEMVAEGDKVAIRVINTGTHKGEFQGILPTGKKVSFGGRDFITLRDGKIVEQRASVDMMELMQQIGAIPAPPTTAGSNTAAHS